MALLIHCRSSHAHQYCHDGLFSSMLSAWERVSAGTKAASLTWFRLFGSSGVLPCLVCKIISIALVRDGWRVIDRWVMLDAGG